MFTGIVEELGEVVALTPGPDSAVLRVRGPLVVSDATPGASIAVNGVCLTVTEFDSHAGEFEVDVMAETLRRSSLGDLAPGSPVNLERAMAAGGRFGGHVVQGHVDGTGTVLARTPGDRWEVVRIGLPDPLRRYVVEKGSICVDGVSLTVSAVGAVGAVGGEDAWFEVSLIPTTLAATTLGTAGVGTRVDLEVDVLAKYVENMLRHADPAGGDAAPDPTGEATTDPTRIGPTRTDPTRNGAAPATGPFPAGAPALAVPTLTRRGDRA